MDFLISSEFYLFWAEGSFLSEGYREGKLLRAESRKPLKKGQGIKFH